MQPPPGAGDFSDPNTDGSRRRPPGGAAGGAVGPQGGAARGMGLEKKHTNSSYANTGIGLPTLLDSSQIAGMLGITERHVRRFVHERRIPFAKVGKFVRFDPHDIERWVHAAKVPVVTPRGHHRAKPTPGENT